jgi:hypothetical protein
MVRPGTSAPPGAGKYQTMSPSMRPCEPPKLIASRVESTAAPANVVPSCSASSDATPPMTGMITPYFRPSLRPNELPPSRWYVTNWPVLRPCGSLNVIRLPVSESESVTSPSASNSPLL